MITGATEKEMLDMNGLRLDQFAKRQERVMMLRGKTQRETLELNGWGVGDILEGDEGHGPSRILITAIGEETFLCRWDYRCDGNYHRESGNTTLACREWRKVGSRDISEGAKNA